MHSVASKLHRSPRIKGSPWRRRCWGWDDCMGFPEELFVETVPMKSLCTICLDVSSNPLETPCLFAIFVGHHFFCEECILANLNHSFSCPNCPISSRSRSGRN